MEINTRSENRINRCRPGFGASCSFCCGSHNYTLPAEDIEKLFIKRGNTPDRIRTIHPGDSFEEKLVNEGMQCAYVGISDPDKRLVCCITYSDDHRGVVFEAFFNGTCRHFLCTAWNELSDSEVLFAAELMKDWYYYSLLINSPVTLISLCNRYKKPSDIPAEILEEKKTELELSLKGAEFYKFNKS